MEQYRCPRCGAIFEGQPHRCPRCNILFRFRKEDPNAPHYILKDDAEVLATREELERRNQPEVREVVKEVEVIKEVPVEVEKIVVEEKAIIPEATKENTYFDGKMGGWLGWTLLGCLVTTFTLGICFPIAYCWLRRWKVNHTVVNGYRLQFQGKGGKLIGRWILWMLLSIITIFIFALWIPTKLEKWSAARTVATFDKQEEEKKEEPQQEEPKQIEEKPAEPVEEAPKEEAK